MAKLVIKRDGTKESFDGEKMRKSIEVALISAGLPMERVGQVVENILTAVFDLAAKKEEINTIELWDAVYGQLAKSEPEASELWKAYEEERRRLS